jgi:hypothetical protein
MVFACVGASGAMYIYDLMENNTSPEFVIVADDLEQKLNKNAFSVRFNPRQRDFVSVGYGDGSVAMF